MNSGKRYGTMNPFGNKSKYFYLRDKRKRGQQHCCQNCGTTDCAHDSNQCNQCRDDYKQHEQKRKHKRGQQHCCQNCGTTDCDHDSNQCDRCRDKNNKNQFEMVEVDPDANVSQGAGQYSFMDQESAELIWVKESCDITVDSRDTQIGVSLQASLQLAIALVLNISIADSNRSNAISQDLMQSFSADQINKQKIFICNTQDATVTTRDTDLAINIQVLLQLLITLVVMVDVL